MKEQILTLFETIDNSNIDKDEKLKLKKEILSLVTEIFDQVPNLAKYDLAEACFDNYPKEISDLVMNEMRLGSKHTSARIHIETNAVLLARICERFNVPPIIPGYTSRISAEDDSIELLYELAKNRKL